MGDWLHTVIKELLAAFIGKTHDDTLPAPSWRWASKMHQWFLVLSLWYYEWWWIINFHTGGVGSLYRQMSRGYSRDSLQESSNLFHLQCYHQVLISVLLYKNSQHNVDKQYQPFRTEINHDARPTIVDTQLTLNFKMGQGANLCLIWSLRQPMHPKQTLTYWT